MASIFMVVEITTKGEQEAMNDDGCSSGERPKIFFMGSDEDKSEKFDNNGMHYLGPDVRGWVQQRHGLDLSGCLGF